MKPSRIAVVALLATGAWQLASGLYIPAKALVAQFMIQHAWQKAREQGTPARLWSWADTAPVARLRAPKHDKDFIVLAGVSGEALAFGPGHLAASATPGGDGHTVIGGHRDTHFRFLEAVEPGDRFELEGLDGRLRAYQVSAVRVVNINVEPLELEPETSRLTLVTCYPFDAVLPGGPWRYVVEASISI